MSNEKKPVEIGRIRLSHIQFRLLTALGIIVTSLGHLLPDAAHSCQLLELIFSRQVVTVVLFGGLLGIIFFGLKSYKPAAEMRQVERCTLLFWAAYAGSSLGPLFGG
jgi:hypothetical protein